MGGWVTRRSVAYKAVLVFQYGKNVNLQEPFVLITVD